MILFAIQPGCDRLLWHRVVVESSQVVPLLLIREAVCFVSFHGLHGLEYGDPSLDQYDKFSCGKAFPKQQDCTEDHSHLSGALVASRLHRPIKKDGRGPQSSLMYCALYRTTSPECTSEGESGQLSQDEWFRMAGYYCAKCLAS